MTELEVLALVRSSEVADRMARVSDEQRVADARRAAFFGGRK